MSSLSNTSLRDDEIISMAVGDIIDDDDDEESMEGSIYLHQPWWETNDLIMFLSAAVMLAGVYAVQCTGLTPLISHQYLQFLYQIFSELVEQLQLLDLTPSTLSLKRKE